LMCTIFKRMKYGIMYRPIFTDISSGKVERDNWILYRKYKTLEDVFNALTDFKKQTFYSTSYRSKTPYETMHFQYKAVELDEI
jgi:hypothetical protein